MDKVLVINLTAITQHVGVIHAEGRKDDVQIMPRKRVELRTGMTVDPAWLGRNIGCVRVIAPKPATPTVAAVRKEPVIVTPDLTVADLANDEDASEPVTVGELINKEGDA